MAKLISLSSHAWLESGSYVGKSKIINSNSEISVHVLYSGDSKPHKWDAATVNRCPDLCMVDLRTY